MPCAVVALLAAAPSARAQMYFGGPTVGGHSPGTYGTQRFAGFSRQGPAFSSAYYQPHFNQLGYQGNFRFYAPYSIYNYGYYQPFGTALYSDIRPNPAAAVNVPGGTSLSAYAPGANSARLTVRVPDGARLWVDDVQPLLTGPVRVMTTPPLQPGQGYYYVMRARWDENGRPVTHERTVRFQAGGDVVVDFTRPDPAASPSASPAAPPLNPGTPPP